MRVDSPAGPQRTGAPRKPASSRTSLLGPAGDLGTKVQALEAGRSRTPIAWTIKLVRLGNGTSCSTARIETREMEKFIIRQPPIGEKDDYDSENSWISDGLPRSSRRRRSGGGRWEVGEWREK